MTYSVTLCAAGGNFFRVSTTFTKKHEKIQMKKNVKKKSNFCIAPKRPKIAFLERPKSTVKKAP